MYIGTYIGSICLGLNDCLVLLTRSLCSAKIDAGHADSIVVVVCVEHIKRYGCKKIGMQLIKKVFRLSY